MRKFYLLLLLLSAFTLVTNAQVNINRNKTVVPAPQKSKSALAQHLKTVSCLDTVWYPQYKATNYLADTMDYKNYIGAVSQNYYFTGNGSIHGLSAYMMTDNDGIPNNSDSVSMVISVRNIAGGIPTSIIASDTVFVYDVGYAHQDLMFQTPVVVNDSFALVIEIDTLNPSNPYYITNDYGNGNTEALSGITSGSTWYNILVVYPTWDVDMIISPIIEIDITAAYTTDKDTIYPNDTVVFTNTSTHITDAMFNLYNTTTNPLYTWNFDDGTGTYHPFDTSYVFSAQGTYNTQLTANYYGYTLNCMDSSAKSIVVKFPLTIEEEKDIKEVTIYPIPANKYFNVNIPSNYFGGEIIITDVVGKTLKKITIENQDKVKITTEEISAGIYFVSIDANGERVFTQRIAIDK